MGLGFRVSGLIAQWAILAIYFSDVFEGKLSGSCTGQPL